MGHPAGAEVVEFDEHNEGHLAVHGVTPAEVMQVVDDDPLWARNVRGHSGNWLMIGRTSGGRPLVIVVVYDEGRSTIRAITGRTCTAAEIARWRV